MENVFVQEAHILWTTHVQSAQQQLTTIQVHKLVSTVSRIVQFASISLHVLNVKTNITTIKLQISASLIKPVLLIRLLTMESVNVSMEPMKSMELVLFVLLALFIIL